MQDKYLLTSAMIFQHDDGWDKPRIKLGNDRVNEDVVILILIYI